MTSVVADRYDHAGFETQRAELPAFGGRCGQLLFCITEGARDERHEDERILAAWAEAQALMKERLRL